MRDLREFIEKFLGAADQGITDRWLKDRRRKERQRLRRSAGVSVAGQWPAEPEAPRLFLRMEARYPMTLKTVTFGERKKIALVAHDNKKHDLVEWARYNRELLANHELCATGTTAKLLEQELDIEVTKLQSGPLGGDQQIGAKIAGGDIDFLIFFWDPLEPLPHDPDVKALLRIAVVWNIPVACNRSSADFIISSPLMATAYSRILPDYDDYRERLADVNPAGA
jgi:methylglyoxal synthase